MDVREISRPEALAVAATPESHFFDRKAVQIDGRKTQKIAVAFGNADGGTFYIGVKDDKDAPIPEDRWSGAKKLEDLNAHLQAIYELNPPVDARYVILSCPDFPGYVLQVTIEKSAAVLKAADGTVYQRHGAQSLPIKDPARITELSFAKGSVSYEQQVLDQPPELITESQELRSFLSEYAPKTHPIDYCVNQHLLDRQSWHVKVAGALLFSECPPAVMPTKCSLRTGQTTLSA